ncbi:MAG: T9SS type A sorting domain-containing protein, partial [Bacteroidota bacterium]
RLSGSGTKSLAQDISVGGGYASPAGNLNLTSLPLDLNQHTLTITNPTDGDSTNGATRFSTGYAISEQNAAANNSIIKWQMGGASNTGTHIFPFGYPGGTQLPVRFNISTTTNADISISTRANSNSCAPNPPGSCNQPWQSTVTQMTAQSTGTDVSVQSVIDRWWQIDASAAATADLTLTYRGAENTTSFPAGSFKIQRWGGTGWNTPIGIGSTGVISGTGTATASGVSSWGPIVISYSSNPLPVEMLYAFATCQKNGVLINWATATEINASYFEIQKSYDGDNFFKIARIKASGSSTSENKYEYTDASVTRNLTYYRIFETDYNGQKYLLKDISKTCITSDNFNVKVYPNPLTGNYVKAVISGLDENENFRVSLTESQGKLIWKSKMLTADKDNAKHGATIRIASEFTLSPGIYFLRTEAERNSSNIKLIVK